MPPTPPQNNLNIERALDAIARAISNRSLINSYSTGGGTFYYMNLGGVKIVWGLSGQFTINAGPTAVSLSFPSGFFTNVQTVVANPANIVAYANQSISVSGFSTSSASFYIFGGGTGAASSVTMIAIGN